MAAFEAKFSKEPRHFIAVDLRKLMKVSFEKKTSATQDCLRPWRVLVRYDRLMLKNVLALSLRLAFAISFLCVWLGGGALSAYIIFLRLRIKEKLRRLELMIGMVSI